MCLRTMAKWAVAEGKRRSELAAKFYGRYLNQVLAKVFLAWEGLTDAENGARRAKSLQAAQFLSGKQEIVKQVTFEKLRKNVVETRNHREQLVLFGAPSSFDQAAVLATLKAQLFARGHGT